MNTRRASHTLASATTRPSSLLLVLVNVLHSHHLRPLSCSVPTSQTPSLLGQMQQSLWQIAATPGEKSFEQEVLRQTRGTLVPRLGRKNGEIYSFVPLNVHPAKKQPRRRYDEIKRLYQCRYVPFLSICLFSALGSPSPCNLLLEFTNVLTPFI